MKRMLLLLMFTSLIGCGSYNSIPNFYEAHKNDSQVTAFRVPQFMFALVSEISPEMKAVVGNTKDLRYMQFPSAQENQAKLLNEQMNSLTGSAFVEVFRKNDDLKRKVITVREKGNVVKEILIYNNNNTTGSFLYFKGNFDPLKIRQLAKEQAFDQFTQGLLPQMNLGQTPGISQ